MRPQALRAGVPPHITEWKDNGRNDIDNEDLACDSCHALVHDGPGGWKTRVASAQSADPGRTAWIAPKHIDPEQRPRVNHRHHLDRILAHALQRYRERQDAELRAHRQWWAQRIDSLDRGGTDDGEIP